MAAQGGSNGAIDNDDESLRYDNNHNFQVYGHQKFKTGAIRSYGNVIACKRARISLGVSLLIFQLGSVISLCTDASEFGGHWRTPGTIVDEPNAMFDNQVWFADHAQYHGTNSGWTGKRAYDNALVGANITMDNLTLAEWQALDPTVNDVGSTYKNVPVRTQAAEIIAAARKLLSLPAEA